MDLRFYNRPQFKTEVPAPLCYCTGCFLQWDPDCDFINYVHTKVFHFQCGKLTWRRASCMLRTESTGNSLWAVALRHSNLYVHLLEFMYVCNIETSRFYSSVLISHSIKRSYLQVVFVYIQPSDYFALCSWICACMCACVQHKGEAIAAHIHKQISGPPWTSSVKVLRF